MSAKIINDLQSLRPIVINSYQGAFGPPTQGHYQSMLFSARAHLKRYPTGLIVMLFMPTAKSSSKPHLLPTQANRIQILNLYCRKLHDTFALEGILENRIQFISSELEYELSKEGKSTSTINTIKMLERVGCDVTLTMGLDNLFDLPYWERVVEYKDILANPAIYVPQRNVSDAESADLIVPYGEDYPIRFSPSASFNKSKKWETISDEIKASLSDLKDRIVFLDFPLPTSSTLLRCGLYKLYGELDNEWNKEYSKHLEILQGFKPSVDDPWHTFYQITKPYVLSACESKNFNSNFEKAGFRGGRRRTRRSYGHRTRKSRKNRK
jgi:nicotinic acid mononucleotide adenylyltransferase